MVAFTGGPTIGKPFNKNFKLSGAFPLIYGLNLGVSYQNIDSGGIAPTYTYGTSAKYPNGTQPILTDGSAAALPTAPIVPACPVAYGCVPGAQAWPTGIGTQANLTLGSLVPAGAISDERIVQLDTKLSRNFRFGKVSIQPTVEAFNLLNVDEVRSRFSSDIGTASGRYLQPLNMLQGRIIGFGANIKW
jgi:hypothetical protein